MWVFLDTHYIGFLEIDLIYNIHQLIVWSNQKKGRKNSTPKDTLNVTNYPDGA
jgi:hypothetical protein